MKHGKQIIEGRAATYSDVVKGGHILPRKELYTRADFKRLVKQGWNQLAARWILICSAVYHGTECSKVLYSTGFRIKCEYGQAC